MHSLIDRPVQEEVLIVKTVLVMRHSHAVSDNPAFVDQERPLTETGNALVQDMVSVVAAWQVQAVVTSSATRTQQTAQQILPAFPDVSEFQARDDLYLATAEQYVHCLKNLSSEVSSVLIIGHNPGVANLLATWSGEHFSVSPGTVAVFRFQTDDWGTLKLRNKHRPELEALISRGQRIR